jgi:hypothetical protein
VSDAPRRPLDDAGLADALRDLATAIAWPGGAPDAPAMSGTTGAPDLATRVGRALRAAPPPRARPWWQPAPARRLGRPLALALLALLVLAAVAGAVALGLPGLRLILAEPSGTPPALAPSATVPAHELPGVGLNLGEPMRPEAAAAVVGRPIPVPGDPRLGAPDAVWVDVAKGDAVALVWAAREDLPASLEPGIGLILMSFEGTVDDELFRKMLGAGTDLQPVSVGGERGYWISGEPHIFFVRSATGENVEDLRRWVGDALVWSDGQTTWRLETSLGREEAIRLAESID